MNRRDFLFQAAVAQRDIRPMRLGFVGVGDRGSYHLDVCLGMDSVEVKAICDTNPQFLYRAKRWVEKAGKPSPALYDRGQDRFPAPVRARRHRHGGHRHALAVSRAGVPGRHAGRQACGHRSARRAYAGRVLGPGGDFRKDRQAHRHAGTGQLQRRGPDGAEHGAEGRVRRGAARDRRLRARPAAGEVRSRARALAPAALRSTATATTIRPIPWDRWPGGSTSTAATVSTTWFR